MLKRLSRLFSLRVFMLEEFPEARVVLIAVETETHRAELSTVKVKTKSYGVNL